MEKEQLVKEARKQVKREKREELKKLVVDTEQRHAAFRDHIQPEQLEFDEHLVTITSMDLNAMASQVNCALGSNQSQTVPDDDQS